MGVLIAVLFFLVIMLLVFVLFMSIVGFVIVVTVLVWWRVFLFVVVRRWSCRCFMDWVRVVLICYFLLCVFCTCASTVRWSNGVYLFCFFGCFDWLKLLFWMIFLIVMCRWLDFFWYRVIVRGSFCCSICYWFRGCDL